MYQTNKTNIKPFPRKIVLCVPIYQRINWEKHRKVKRRRERKREMKKIYPERPDEFDLFRTTRSSIFLKSIKWLRIKNRFERKKSQKSTTHFSSNSSANAYQMAYPFSNFYSTYCHKNIIQKYNPIIGKIIIFT